VGAEKPLTQAHWSADWFMAGMDWGITGIPRRGGRRKDGAAEAIVELVEAHPGIVMVTLGPLTNVARALQKRPEIAKSRLAGAW